MNVNIVWLLLTISLTIRAQKFGDKIIRKSRNDNSVKPKQTTNQFLYRRQTAESVNNEHALNSQHINQHYQQPRNDWQRSPLSSNLFESDRHHHNHQKQSADYQLPAYESPAFPGAPKAPKPNIQFPQFLSNEANNNHNNQNGGHDKHRQHTHKHKNKHNLHHQQQNQPQQHRQHNHNQRQRHHHHRQPQEQQNANQHKSIVTNSGLSFHIPQGFPHPKNDKRANFEKQLMGEENREGKPWGAKMSYTFRDPKNPNNFMQVSEVRMNVNRERQLDPRETAQQLQRLQRARGHALQQSPSDRHLSAHFGSRPLDGQNPVYGVYLH